MDSHIVAIVCFIPLLIWEHTRHCKRIKDYMGRRWVAGIKSRAALWCVSRLGVIIFLLFELIIWDLPRLELTAWQVIVLFILLCLFYGVLHTLGAAAYERIQTDRAQDKSADPLSPQDTDAP